MAEVRALITDKVKGKRIDFLGVQDNCLLIVTTDGQTYRIGWRGNTNELVPGSPSLEGIDMRILIDPLEISGQVGF